MATTLGAPAAPETPPIFLGSSRATQGHRRLAAEATLVLVAAFAATAPWADRPMAVAPSFAPIYNAAVIVLDLVTAFLLFVQFSQIRERAFLALGCGYIFTPVLMVAHALSFNDAFVPGRLVGGPQTTAWLWMAWHGVFPFFVMLYAVAAARERGGTPSRVPARAVPRMTALAVAATLALAAAAVSIAIFGERGLPALMAGDAYRSAFTQRVLAIGWAAHLVALGMLLAFTRGRRMIDVWIGVTLVALVIDLALSAILVNGRYELGWYLGRVYGLLGAIFVLAVLLRQTVRLQGINESLREEMARRRGAEAKRRDLLRQLVNVQEAERRRISRDLHDQLGQQMSALSLKLAMMRRSAAMSEALRAEMKALEALARDAENDLDYLVWQLRPMVLDDLGLLDALRDHVATWSSHFAIAAWVQADGLDGRRFDAEIETVLYRAAQEALSNIVRHARARHVALGIRVAEGELVLEIHDDGVGFERAGAGAAKERGFGLRGMRERAELLGGMAEVISAPGGGTSIVVRVPAGR